MTEKEMRLGLIKMNLQYADMLIRQKEELESRGYTEDAKAAVEVIASAKKLVAEQSIYFKGHASYPITLDEFEDPNNFDLINPLNVAGPGKH